MIKAATINHFMAHTRIDIESVPSINLLVGKNDTGKTGILKLLYGTAKSLEIYSLKKRSETAKTSFKKELSEKLFDTFMPRKNGLGDLVQKGGNGKLNVDITFQIPASKYKQPINFSFGDRTDRSITDCIEHVEEIPEYGMNALFIPAKEVLTAFNDIRSMREQFFGVGFDDTYFDLIKALALQTTRGRVANELSNVNANLTNLFDGKIEQTNQNDQPFIFKRNGQQFAMQQTAEGIKKIGILSTLINNRQISKGTLLFMDEPETALHPNAIRKMVEMLVDMSKAGVQIFLATHSYFVIKQMAICAKREKLDALCWSLERAVSGSVEGSFHNMKDGLLPSNSIVDEALSMYNDDIKLQLGL